MKKNKVIIFILGAMSFTVSQVFLRMPLLNFLMKTSQFNLLQVLYPLVFGIGIAFSAGLFEESFRFIFKNYLLRPDRTSISEPIIFGLGHGLTEAVILLGPYLTSVAIEDLTFAILERVFAITIHVGLSVVVWNGFQKDKKIKYLLLAIIIHGATNSLIPIMIIFVNSILWIEAALGLVAIIMITYVLRSKRLYIQEEEKI
nr:YhfC family glutamic-type intramembrane protease [Tissierella sp.]